MKKKTLVPLIIFLLGICLVSLIVYITDTHEKKQRHTMAQLNATTYGERIKNEITDGIEITDTLEQVIISENGEFHQFDTIAKNLMSDSIESMQLAPNGIVTEFIRLKEIRQVRLICSMIRNVKRFPVTQEIIIQLLHRGLSN